MGADERQAFGQGQGRLGPQKRVEGLRVESPHPVGGRSGGKRQHYSANLARVDGDPGEATSWMKITALKGAVRIVLAA